MALFPDKSHVGLYVDSETISVVNGQTVGSTIETRGFAELHVPTAVEGSPDAKQKALDDIRTALNTAGVHSRSVRISVPGDRSIMRHFELPALPKREERSAVRFEAQKYVPFDMKELYYDYETYPDAERKKNRVVFFACKKQWVDSLNALLTLEAKKISQVELVSQSVARAFHRHGTKRPDEVSLVIIGNGPDTAEIIVQKQGSVLTTRHVGLARLADGTALDVPMFVSDVRISIDYFSENFHALKVERIHLVTPFSAEPQAVCDALQKDLSLPVSAGGLFKPPSASASTTAAVAAYGLTLGALEKKLGRRVSLKPTETQAVAPAVSWEEEKKQLHDLAIKEILGIAVLMAGLFFLIGNLTGAKQRQLQAAVASHPQAQSASLTEPISALQDKEMTSAQKMAYFNLLNGKRVYFTTKMNELAKEVPTNVRLSRWSYADELTERGESQIQMSLEGYVLSPGVGSEVSVVNKLVTQLSENRDFMQGFTEIRITRTAKENLNGQWVTRFALDCSNAKG